MVIIAAMSVPFRITFVSDTFEGEGTLGPEWDANQMNTAATPVTVNNGGFKITYEQS